MEYHQFLKNLLYYYHKSINRTFEVEYHNFVFHFDFRIKNLILFSLIFGLYLIMILAGSIPTQYLILAVLIYKINDFFDVFAVNEL